VKTRILLLFLVLAAVSAAAAQAGAPPRAESMGLVTGVANAKGEASGKSTSPSLIYHGGPVMTNGAAVTAIYWGTSWSGSDPKIGWLGKFYGGVGGSSYVGTNTEYTDASGAHVSRSVTYNGAIVDNAAAPKNAPQVSDILGEVTKVIKNPVPNGYYPVYVDTARKNAHYCAWHTFGTVNGVTVQFGFFFDLDGDPGCDPISPVTTYSQGVAALANVSGHELSEMLTDPNLNAWYDSAGAENSDKCAWTFGARPVRFGGVAWKIQGNWSNAAYAGNAGYTDPDVGFVRGCIDGSN
jgi:hypothetical protein